MSAFTRIPLVDEGEINRIRALFEKHVDASALQEYRLPQVDTSTRVIVGLSGGADSSVLAMFAAIYLAPHYRKISYIFTDTKAEPESAYDTLERLEVLLGIEIQRLTPEKGLFELIDQFNGYLPSGQARWCTRELKVEPLLSLLKGIGEGAYVSLAGIRYDESDRDGISFQYSMEHAHSAFPFVDLKLTKTAVFDILQGSIGIPETYAYRSRSGCYSCFFQRNTEIIGMMLNAPSDYALTEAREKLSAEDDARWRDVPVALSDLGINAYYPVPAFVDIRSPVQHPTKQPPKCKAASQLPIEDMFGGHGDETIDLFAAFALYVEPMLGLFGGRDFTPGVYHQQFITLSTSIEGLRSALGTYYSFRKTTPMPQYDVDDLKIVIAQVRFPAGAIDTKPPGAGSFTWKSSFAYKQLRHLVKHCQLTLERADLLRRYRQAASIANGAPNDDVCLDAVEEFETLEELLRGAPQAPGRLIWEGLYTPTRAVTKSVQLQLDGISQDSDIRPARQTLEFDEVPRACLACSI